MAWRISIIILLITMAVAIIVEHVFTNTQIRTIKNVISSDTVGGTVAIKGEIVYAEENRFILNDGTGMAELATCPVWYKRVNLYEGDRVTVVGQVMNNPSMLTRCDFVLSVYKVFKGGEVIQVRSQPGKPPWTSYPAPGEGESWR